MATRVQELFSQWKQTIVDGALPGVVGLYGESDTLVKRALEVLLDELFKGGGRGLNCQTYDGRSSRPSEWLVAVRTAPMMAARRVVVVTDAEALFAGDGPDGETVDALLAFANSGVRKGLMVLTARAIDGRSKLAKGLKKAKGLFPFESFENKGDINEFIRGLFRKRGINIEPAAIQFLADALGRSTEAIISEVDKLSEYATDSKTVTLADAQEMVQRLQGHEIFELNRALVQRDTVRSLTLLDRMYHNLLASKRKVSASGLPLLVLSTCVEAEFRKMAIAKKFAATNDAKGLAAALKLRNQSVASIIMNNARRFTVEELEEVLSHTREVDKRLKSSSLSPKLLLEELIVTICTGRRRPAARSR